MNNIELYIIIFKIIMRNKNVELYNNTYILVLVVWVSLSKQYSEFENVIEPHPWYSSIWGQCGLSLRRLSRIEKIFVRIPPKATNVFFLILV